MRGLSFSFMLGGENRPNVAKRKKFPFPSVKSPGNEAIA